MEVQDDPPSLPRAGPEPATSENPVRYGTLPKCGNDKGRERSGDASGGGRANHVPGRIRMFVITINFT